MITLKFYAYVATNLLIINYLKGDRVCMSLR